MQIVRRLASPLILSLIVAPAAQAQARLAPAFEPAAVVAYSAAPSPALTPALTPASIPPAPALLAGGFASSGFAQFMASPAGRVFRVVAGAGMIAGGIAMDNTGGNVLAVAGTVPLSAGLFDICWLSPIFGGPLHGKAIRAAKR